MTKDQLRRATEIQARLKDLAHDRIEWENGSSVRVLMELWPSPSSTINLAIPAPVMTFKHACLDAIATEEAVLQREFDAL